MAFFANHFSHFLLFTVLLLSFHSHTHARDLNSQFFNKITTTKNLVPESKQPLNNQQEPDFLPENENNYGLYSHDSAATTTPQPLRKDLPTNYNPVAYVNEPQETTTFAEDGTFTPKQKEDSRYENNLNNNNYYYNGGGGSSFRPQGMSDTRFLENGKYFYDVNRQKYSDNHPYESLRANRERNNKNLYGNSEEEEEDAYDQFRSENYQKQEEFQEDYENNNLP